MGPRRLLLICAAVLLVACAPARAGAISPPASVARGPGVIDAAGTVHLFEVVGDQLLQSELTSGGTWRVGAIAAGTFTCDPSALIDAARTLHVFVCTGDDIEDFSQGTTGPWTDTLITAGSYHVDLGGVAEPGGAVDVFADTGAGINHYLRAPGGSWGGEIPAYGSFDTPPAALLSPSGAVELYAIAGGTLYHLEKSPSGPWSQETVTNGLGSAPGPAAALSPLGYQLFVDTGAGINHYEGTSGSWGGEIAAYGPYSLAPSAVVDPNGAVQLFAADSSGLVHLTHGATWNAETIDTGPLDRAPFALVSDSGTLYVLTHGSGGYGLQIRQPGGAWQSQAVPVTPTAVTLSGTTSVTAPATTGRRSRRRHLHVAISFRWRLKGRATLVSGLRLRHLPRHLTIAARCAPHACHARRRITARQLRRLVDGRDFAGGERVTITFYAPRAIPERIVISFRTRRAPRGRVASH